MSYLRSPVYVWVDSAGTVHIWPRDAEEAATEMAYARACMFPAGVAVPQSAWDAVCLKRAAEIFARRGGQRYARRLQARYGGTFAREEEGT